MMWNAETGKVLHTLKGHKRQVTSVAFSPDGKWLLSSSSDQTLLLWDVARGEVVQQLNGHSYPVSSVVFSPDGRFALSGGESDPRRHLPGELILWDLTTGEMARQLGTEVGLPAEGVRSIAIHPDGSMVLVGVAATRGNEYPLLLWDLSSGEMIHPFEGLARSINDVAFSSDGHYALSAGADDLVRLWNLETREEIFRLEGHEGIASTVAFSPDGRRAVSAGLDQMIILWDLDSGEPLQRLRGHTDSILTVRFVGENRVVSASLDGTLRLWDLEPAWQLSNWRGTGRLHHQAGVRALAVSPTGRYALSGSDPDLILWDYHTGEPIRRLEGHENAVWAVAFSQEGRRALSGSSDGHLIYWNVETGAAVRHLEGHRYAVNDIDISADDRFALTASSDNTVILWDLQTGEVVHHLNGHADVVQSVMFFQNDEMAISSGWDASLILWDLATGEQVNRLTGMDGQVGGHLVSTDQPIIYDIALASDGRTLLSAGTDKTLLAWDIVNDETTRRFLGHNEFPIYVDIGPDDRYALSSGVDGTLIWWNVISGAPLRRFTVPDSFAEFGISQYAAPIAISPEGQTALSGRPDGAITQWRFTEPTPAEIVPWIGANRHVRALTCQERELYQIEPFCDANGHPTDEVQDLLTEVEMNLSTVEPTSPLPSPLASPPPLPAALTRTPRNARVGENRGELARHDFDVWAYEGRVGEILALQMIADKPIADGTPRHEQNAHDSLDALLILIAPDGSQLALGDNQEPVGGMAVSDARIEGIRLPMSGTYLVQARSYWDEGAGGYSLFIESHELILTPEVMNTYVGQYIHQDLSGLIVTIYLEDGRLYYDAQGYGLFEMVPLSETEFIVGIMHLTFLFDEAGNVSGYDIVGAGQEYHGLQLEE